VQRSHLIAGALALGATGWVLSGQFDLGAEDGSNRPKPETVAAVSPVADSRPAVRTRALVARPYQVEVVARGRTEAVRSVEVKAEVQGRVVEIGAAKGARVKAGDVLVRLAVDDRAAWLAEAEAQLRQRQIEYAAAKALADKGFRPETKLAEAGALLDAARARVKQMEIQIGKLTIRAPFDGVVNSRYVEIGDFVKDANRIATVVDEDPFLVIAQLSEREVGQIKLGDPGRATLVDGRTVEGRVRYIATTADPATRTFRVEIAVPNPARDMRDGVTAELRIATAAVMAHLVSPAILTLDVQGKVGVRVVDESGIVQFRPVTLVADANDGVWIAGLPERVTVVTVGQEAVRDGERVRVTPEGAGKPS
jgi:multidrug efflux system membrane fusion protein